ncbi:hypothetical protein ACFZA1_40295, partial [Streptomyces filipinensis]|uniref:hypothetical protein n=1 Tax=Streptomyces filipinensis TaxID=66887 RepID=UPI0036E89541
TPGNSGAIRSHAASVSSPRPTTRSIIKQGLGQRTAWYWSNDSLQWLAYLLIAFGWVLTTAVIAGATRTLQKN